MLNLLFALLRPHMSALDKIIDSDGSFIKNHLYFYLLVVVRIVLTAEYVYFECIN